MTLNIYSIVLKVSVFDHIYHRAESIENLWTNTLECNILNKIKQLKNNNNKKHNLNKETQKEA